MPEVIPGDVQAPGEYTGVRRDHIRIGGRLIRSWQPVDPGDTDRLNPAARDHVLVVGFSGGDIARLPGMEPRGFGLGVDAAAPELFFKNRRMTLARWPDEGFATIADLPEGEHGTAFTLTPRPPEGIGQARDLWAFGYWHWDWAGALLPVHLAPKSGAQTFTLGEPGSTYGLKKGQRVYLENALALLDRPGEWYLDRGKGRLYFWPPSPIEGDDAVLSWAPTVLRISGAHGLTLDGLTLGISRGPTVVIEDSTDVVLRHCHIFGSGTAAVVIRHSERSGLQDCLIEDTGGSAVVMDGGDYATLRPGGNFVERSELRHVGAVSRTMTAAVVLSGVGQRVTGNRIHDAPQMAIHFDGNDHLIDGNLIWDVVKETGDAGAIYTGRSWVRRGSVIQGNVICRVTSRFSGGANGIYLDDTASGVALIRNRLLNVQRAILVGGGSDNLLIDNIVARSPEPLKLDARGLTFARDKLFAKGQWDMRGRSDQVPWRSPAYAVRYPTLGLMLGGAGATPSRNVLQDNLLLGSGRPEIDPRIEDDQLIAGNRERAPKPREIASLFPPECMDAH